MANATEGPVTGLWSEATRTKLREKDHTILRLQANIRSYKDNSKLVDEANAEEVRCLKATIDVHLVTIQDQNERLGGRGVISFTTMQATIRRQSTTIFTQEQKIQEQDAINAAAKTEIQRLSNLLLSATDRHSEDAIEASILQEAIEEQADIIRDRDGTITAHHKEYRTMVQRIEALTPEYDERDDDQGACYECGSTQCFHTKRAESHDND